MTATHPPLEFEADPEDQVRLAAALSRFDVLIQGNELGVHGQGQPAEEREKPLREQGQRAGLPMWFMRMGNKASDGLDDAKDRFAVHREGHGDDHPLWHELPAWLAAHCAGKHLLLDLTTLSGSSVFQLHGAASLARCVRLSYAYTTPKRYPQVDRPDEIPPVITRSIKQPYGYRSFAQEQLRFGKRRHIIVLGFDRHRPNKFIEHYQWPLDDVYALLGDPAYVQGGVEQAQFSLGSVFAELRRLGHVRVINPKLLYSNEGQTGIVDALQALCGAVASVDLVPLGPKPTLLGCVVYWHSLPELARAQTRLLFDFPVSRQVRTDGVGATWLYRDVLTPAI
jgi:hypothetical protein